MNIKSMPILAAAPLILTVTPQLSLAQEAASQLLSIQTIDTDPSTQQITFEFSKAPAVKTFALSDPNRIVFDFLKTNNKASSDLSLKGIGAQNLELIGDEQRLRAILNIYSDTVPSDRWDGNKYIVTLQRKNAQPSVQPSTDSVQLQTPLAHEISRINYQKGASNGSGKLSVDLSHANTKFEIKSIKGGAQIDFLDTTSPTNLMKKFDLSEFMTPLSSMEVTQLSDRTRLTLRAQGKWEQTAYQLENRFIFEVKPVTLKADGESKEDAQYKGSKISLDFQNIEVRAVLQLLSDFSGYNIIASDTVTGTLTIRLKNVPWDQALDLVLQSRSLDKRTVGNIIRVAPQTELRNQEKAEADYRNERNNTQALMAETFTINYAKASDIVTLLTNAQQKMLSSRGSAVVDPRTNTLFVQDIGDRLQAVRALIKKVDIPVRQVMVEARIVEATDTFGKSLGVRLGMNNSPSNIGGIRSVIGGNVNSSATASNQPNASTTFNDTYMVNLPAAGSAGAAPGVLSLVLFNNSATRFLNMELSALVSDGRGQILSNPRVVTSDKQSASIQQGTQIPYQQASSSGATSVAFKNATLNLTVTPQITPDGNVLMQLQVNKDSIGANTSAGPAIDTKSIQTNVLVEDGGTVVIGGIYTQDDTASSSKVPFFGDLPVVGNLFKQKAAARERREMLVFITPRIIRDKLVNDDMEAAQVTKQTIAPVLMDPTLVDAQTPEKIRDLKLPKPNFDHK